MLELLGLVISLGGIAFSVYAHLDGKEKDRKITELNERNIAQLKSFRDQNNQYKPDLNDENKGNLKILFMHYDQLHTSISWVTIGLSTTTFLLLSYLYPDLLVGLAVLTIPLFYFLSFVVTYLIFGPRRRQILQQSKNLFIKMKLNHDEVDLLKYWAKKETWKKEGRDKFYTEKLNTWWQESETVKNSV